MVSVIQGGGGIRDHIQMRGVRFLSTTSRTGALSADRTSTARPSTLNPCCICEHVLAEKKSRETRNEASCAPDLFVFPARPGLADLAALISCSIYCPQQSPHPQFPNARNIHRQQQRAHSCLASNDNTGFSLGDRLSFPFLKGIDSQLTFVGYKQFRGYLRRSDPTNQYKAHAPLTDCRL